MAGFQTPAPKAVAAGSRQFSSVFASCRFLVEGRIAASYYSTSYLKHRADD